MDSLRAQLKLELGPDSGTQLARTRTHFLSPRCRHSGRRSHWQLEGPAITKMCVVFRFKDNKIPSPPVPCSHVLPGASVYAPL